MARMIPHRVLRALSPAKSVHATVMAVTVHRVVTGLNKVIAKTAPSVTCNRLQSQMTQAMSPVALTLHPQVTQQHP